MSVVKQHVYYNLLSLRVFLFFLRSNFDAFKGFDLGKCLLQISKAPEWVLQDELEWVVCIQCFCQ